ncbi:MAG TPA: PilC/PilY family type IV pilus protein [Cellvibrionaceae bacterium]
MKYLITPLFYSLAILSVPATAAISSSDSSQLPPGLLQNNAPPVVMLTMPKDHQLFFKAYSDYEDLDGGDVETTFKPTIEYVGYFDNKLCYEYNSVNGWLEPKTEVYSETITVGSEQRTAWYCNKNGTKYWSGNFLNWASMTRIDILRQTFYGGKRVNPQPSNIDGVLLERSHIPGDAHSFAKYYDKADLPQLTPYPPSDDLSCPSTSKNTQKCSMVQKGITLCNTTYNSTTAEGAVSEGTLGLTNDFLLSQNTENRPLIRVARGNFSLWAAGERIQCKYWESLELNGGTSNITNELSDPANSAKLNSGDISQAYNKLMEDLFPTVASQPGYYFFHDSPSVNTNKEGGKYVAKYEPDYSKKNYTQKLVDLQARVIACPSTIPRELPSSSICTLYGSKYKPTGLLQSTDPKIAQVQWGLISGSFKSNITGGTLRRHVGPISNEIDKDGEFNYIKSTAKDDGGIIAFLDNLRIVNWGYYKNPDSPANTSTPNSQKSSYVGWDGDNCGAAANSFPWGKLASFGNGSCVSWGNPLSEILLDAYNYLAGKTAHSRPLDENFFTNSVAKRAMTSLEWTDNPLAKSPTDKSSLKKCSNLNVLAINGSTTSWDKNDITDFGSLTTAEIEKNTNIIGSQDLKGQYFIPVKVDDTSSVCKPGTIKNLTDVTGTCPDAPSLAGGYLMAGMAYKAHITPKINPNGYDSSIKTLAVSLAMGEAKIGINTNNVDGDDVVILPSCLNKSKINSVGMGTCAIVDFKILERDKTSGTYLIIWEDSQQGSDFDQDATQVIRYSFDGSKLKVTNKVLSESTGDDVELGYTISGLTANEGPNGFIDIHSNTSAESIYTPGPSTNKVLESPLFYAAKWGGFKDKAQKDTSGKDVFDQMPMDKSEYDVRDSKTRENKPDGIPDNYLEVVNPVTLTKDIKDLLQPASPAVFTYAAIGSVNTLDDGTGLSISALFRPDLELDLSSSEKPVSWLGSLAAYGRDAAGNLLDSYGKTITFKTELDDKGTPVTYANENPISALDFSSPIWSAEKNLAKITDYTTQVTYTDDRIKGRYIFTALDANNDGLITLADSTTTHVPFDTTEGFPATDTTKRARWLDTTAGTETDLVNYIRGQENNNYRSRRLDFIANYSDKKDGETDTKEPWLLGDIINSSPLIVGAPKAGYDRDYGDETYNAFREHYKNRRNVAYVGANDGMLHAFAVNTAGPYTAGDELWGYIPFNLLPHVKWLAEKDYHHNYYVDGRVKFYDVNIFDEKDTDHPGGWGTLLVVTMRTGGKAYPIDADGDGTSEHNLRSAIILMDVTNPEKPPTLIAEIPLPDASFTTVNPDIVKFRERDTDGKFTTNNWYLAVATGVTDPKDFTSNLIPKLYLFDLSVGKMSWVNSAGTAIGSTQGWVGGINSRDWDGDYKDDYIYFGTVEGTPVAPSGQLYRTKVNVDGTVATPAKVLDIGTDKRAFAATPFTVVDKKGKYWVFAGTGRYFVDDDNLYNNNQNTYYAVKEPVDTAGDIKVSTAKTSLVNLTGINVQKNEAALIGGGTIANRKDLETKIRDASGWFFDLETVNSRNYTSTILVNNVLVFNTYEPGDACSPYGYSSQYQLDFFSGLPRAIRNSTSIEKLDKSRKIGDGAASDPSPGNKTTTGTSLGGIDISEIAPATARSSRQSWRELPFSR